MTTDPLEEIVFGLRFPMLAVAVLAATTMVVDGLWVFAVTGGNLGSLALLLWAQPVMDALLAGLAAGAGATGVGGRGRPDAMVWMIRLQSLALAALIARVLYFLVLMTGLFQRVW